MLEPKFDVPNCKNKHLLYNGTGTPPITRFSYTAVFHLTRFFKTKVRVKILSNADFSEKSFVILNFCHKFFFVNFFLSIHFSNLHLNISTHCNIIFSLLFVDYFWKCSVWLECLINEWSYLNFLYSTFCSKSGLWKLNSPIFRF